jgi:hypothetical protein
MAETNVPITAGSGTNIATFTDASSNRRQVVILGDTSANTAPVDGTNGLAVAIIPALPAGANAIGTVTAVQSTLTSLKGTMTIVDSAGGSATDTTSHAVKILPVTAAGSAIPMDATNGMTVTLSGAIPAGANSIGTVTAAQATIANLKATVTPIDAGGTTIADTTSHSMKILPVTAAGTAIPMDATNGMAVTLITALPAGSAAIGTVTAAQSTIANLKATVTTVDSGGTSMTDTTAHAIKVLQVDSTGANVGTNVAATTDTITAKLATDTIQNGTTALTPKFAKIAVSSSGVNSFIALVGGKKLRCLGFAIMGNGAVNVKFQSHVTPTDLTGLFYIAAAGGGVSMSFNPLGWFETVSGEAMDINLSGAVAVGGVMCYCEV